jgi:NAD(P)-dependent dehydrogenase (short-subunit alcohol dehydrogenase family)
MEMTPNDQKIILLTGATDGIGKLAAGRLADLGHTVLVHGRSPGKVERVTAEIRKASGNRNLSPFTADLASLAEVRRLAEGLRDRFDRLDVLINNAGVLPAKEDKGERPLSEDGHELCLAVNYLAPFLLTHLLMPLLRAAPAARILNVSSAAQERVDCDDLELEKETYAPMHAYARSKLALAMFTMELNDRLKADNDKTTVNCLHPGTLLDTKMVRQAFSRPQGGAESGADVEVYLAVSPDVEGVSGAYFDRKTRARAHDQAYDLESRDRLWQRTLALTGLVTYATA